MYGGKSINVKPAPSVKFGVQLKIIVPLPSFSAAAEKEGRGTIIFNWTPNFTDGAGFTFIDFPPYTAGCRPADGGDGKCGSPDGYLKKAVHEDFPKTHPDAAAAFKKLSFSTSQIGAMAALVDVDKMTHEDAAKKWLADNESTWKAFLK